MWFFFFFLPWLKRLLQSLGWVSEPRSDYKLFFTVWEKIPVVLAQVPCSIFTGWGRTWMWVRFICLALVTDGWPESTSSWVTSLEEAITRTLLSSPYTYWILRWPGAPVWENDAHWLIQCLSRAVLKWPGGVPHEHKLFLTSRKKIQAEFIRTFALFYLLVFGAVLNILSMPHLRLLLNLLYESQMVAYRYQ